jgi:putative transposase
MKSKRSSRYSGYRFPSEIISYAIWAYHRFCLSFRDVEDLLAERGILVSYETIRLWCQKFGADYVRKLKRRQGRLGDHWHLDEVFLRINGQLRYLWRAIDQDGDVIDILVQPRRDRRAAERFFRRLLRGQARQPLCIITDGLRSYSAAIRTACATWLTRPSVTPTIDWRLRISQRAIGNGRCVDSNPPGKPNGFSPSTAWFTICSGSDAT